MPDTIAVRDFRMVIKYLLSSLFILLALISNASADDSISISHELDVALLPQDSEIQVIDRISLSSEVTTSPEFLLSGNMIAKVSHGELQLVTDSQETGIKKIFSTIRKYCDPILFNYQLHSFVIPIERSTSK